jgi:predicted nucleic acid-binding protein
VADVVVDASVFASRVLTADAHHAPTNHWLEAQAALGVFLVVPAPLIAEVGGALSRRTGDAGFARRAVEILLRLPNLRLIGVDRRLGTRAAELAADLQLRGADAVYVALAHHLGLPLVTWDREQRDRAAGTIATMTPAR